MEWTNAGVQSRLHGMRRLSAQPLSSDEGAESGEDSEEDMVTSYLPSGGGQGTTAPATANTSPHRHPPPLYHTHHHTHHHTQQPTHGSVQPPHGHPGRRLVRMAEIPTMDSVSSGDPTGPSAGGFGSGGANYPHGVPSSSHASSIPIISITPHSPVVNKPFAVLEDNIRLLQNVQENIQRMRDAGLSVKNSRSLSRLSSSCPSLNVEGEADATSSPYSPWSEEFLLDVRKGGGADGSRRRSWSGLSDTEKKRARQRSVSLSSFDSDGEEPFYDADSPSHPPASEASADMGRDKPRSLSGGSSPGASHPRGSSTHSLNDVHLDKAGGPAAGGQGGQERPRLLAPRLTLQKSISTPSILANVTAAQQRPAEEEEQGSTKRRKRGSIFFRKKKDKSRKTCHQFVSVCFSNSATCDVCAKPMVNKPALRCEACQVCVHEHSCRDNISDCSKLKTSKGFPKPGVPLSAAAKSSSLGSNPSSGGPSILSSGVLSHSSGVASRARSTVGHSSSPTRPHSLIASNTRGVNDDKDGGEALQETTDNNILDTNSASMESLDDASEEPASSNSSTLDDIDGDPDLRLLEKEPELWVHTVDQATVDGLTDRQVKKQEHIYELIITEKHHCRMLRVMQKVFVAGMTRELGMPQNRVRRVFPCLDELLTLHCSFLWRLRQKQRDNKYIATIGDLLLEQFVGDNAQGLKDAYGVFCSHHQDAVSYFKELCKTDRRFNAFIAQRYSHPLMKKKGIPECILFMTHRITKYPLMIEAIIKYSRDQEEESAILKRALENIKEILVNINSQVAEKERKQRLLEIYHKIDAKSSTTYKDLKFKKSDLLNNSRTLKFEGTAVLLQQRGKPLLVQVVVMSDLVFFVHENNQKYYFVSPDNKAGVIPLEKLLIREKAGDNARAIYFIHEKNQAEMFEMECQHPKDKKIWFCSIREAVEQCPDEEEGSDGASGSTVTANAERLRHLLATLQHKDRDIAQLCEEKEACMAEILSEWGCPSQHLVAQSPQLRALLDELSVDPAQARQLQIKSLTDAMKLVSGACGWGSGLARSVSSVGEHQSDAYVSPSLPKRAETFGGFDNSNKDGNTAAAGAAAAQNTAAAPQLQTKAAQSGGKKKKDGSRMAAAAAVAAADPSSADSSELSVSKRLAANARRPSASLLTPRASQDNLSLMSGFSSDVSTVVGSAQDLMHQQQENAARLMSCLHVALVLSQHHITQHEMLLRGSSLGSNTEARFRHSQKLEELRNIQEQISLERHSYAKERDAREKWLQDKSDQLHALEESLKAAEEDVCQQRDLLYRQLEVLKNQGIILSPSLNVFFNSGCPSPGSLKGDTSGSSHSSPTGGIPTTRPHKAPRSTPPITKRDSSTALPTHLISATNQQKGPVSVKQQLPMKLAKLGSGGSSSSSSSMSSSLGGSMGGSMSPSQEQRASPNVSHMSKSSGQSSVTQILPLKLSESVGESRKGSGGYQRLHSPPPPVGEDSGNPSTHHRTGSSPATLQNGSNNPTPDVAAGILGAGSVSGSLASGGQKAARTNTYPKLANKPTLLPASGTGSLGAREGGSVAAQQQLMQQQMSQLQQQQQHSSQLQQQFTTQLHQQQPTQLLQHQQLIQHQQQLLLQQQQQQQAPSISNTRPGQRIKDPDTNEDIIFF